MNRIVIQDFLGGMYSAADPESIPDNACALIENYEYKDMRYPQKRMGTTPSELAYLTGVIKAIAVWNPRIMPHDCTGDKVYVVAMDDMVMIVYEVEEGLLENYLFTDIHQDSEIHLYPSQERVLVTDTHQNGRFIAIDKDGIAYGGMVGLKAPVSIPYISASGDNNFYSGVSETDTGMTVERGVILQYCYTLEDEYGVESNPSPIATQKTMAYRYPDTTPPGFKYYWHSTKIRNMSCLEYAQETRDRLRYYNVYRRDVDFREGTIAKQFVLVGRVPVGSTGVVSYSDSSSLSLADISYDNHPAPRAKTAAESAGLIFMAGIETPSITFPFEFDRFVEIEVNNNNATDYVAPIIQVKLTKAACGVESFAGYLSNPNRIRMFAQDMRTPIPVVCKLNAGNLDCYVMPPYLNRETINRFYLCLADDLDGVTNPSWNSYAHGKFFQIIDDEWTGQPIFDISRPLKLDHHICTNVPYSFDYISYYGHLFNLSAMHQKGLVKYLNGSASIYTPSEYDYSVAPYGDEKELTTRAYKLRADVHIDYTLLLTPDAPVLMVYEGSFVPTVIKNALSLYSELISCGNFSFFAWYTPGEGIKIGYRVSASSGFTNPTVITVIEAVASKSPLHMKLYLYLKKRSIQLKMAISTSIDEDVVEYSADIGRDVVLATELSINKPDDPDNYYSVTDDDVYYVSRFDLLEMPELSSAEVDRLFDCFEKGATFFRTPIGKSATTDFANENIAFEQKTIKSEPGKNAVVWSNISGSAFPSLNSKLFSEPVAAIVLAPSYMRMQYQNTLVVFTRNTISRIILADDLESMAASTTNEIEEYSSGGLYANESLVLGGGAMFWLSESGVIRWDREEMSNISYGIMDIPVHKNYVAIWVDTRAQYLLHDKDSGISYVFHDHVRKWTVFTGLSINKHAALNFGEYTENRTLIVTEDSDIVEYPGLSPEESCDYRIISKAFYLGNRKAVRYRLRFGEAAAVGVRVVNSMLHLLPVTYSVISPQRFKWIMLPTTAWGETIQFLVDNATGLHSIEIDLKEGV